MNSYCISKTSKDGIVKYVGIDSNRNETIWTTCWKSAMEFDTLGKAQWYCVMVQDEYLPYVIEFDIGLSEKSSNVLVEELTEV